MDNLPDSIAITGASAGLGAALAHALARPGRTLFLCARNIDALQKTAADGTAAGATVHTSRVDVRDQPGVEAWVRECDAVAPIGLIIVNAGLFGGKPAPGTPEPPHVTEALIGTNLAGAIHTAHAAAACMRARRLGHIALISSLAAKLPSADAPGYSAAKAGLSAFGQALREDLAPDGITVTLVHPGHIQTAQTDQQNGPLPLMISPDDAAARVVRGLAKGQPDISLPLLANLWVRTLAVLPWRWRARLARDHRFTVKNRDPE